MKSREKILMQKIEKREKIKKKLKLKEKSSVKSGKLKKIIKISTTTRNLKTELKFSF